MAPKEKAKELVNHYRMVLMQEDTDCGNEILCTLIGIKCALIAVYEIINVLPKHEYLEDRKEYVENREITYWQEVKQEIEKL